MAGLTWMLLGMGRVATAAREHRAILAALQGRDGAAAAELMRLHLGRETKELVERRIALYGPSGGGKLTRAAMGRALAAIEEELERVFAFLDSARDEAVREMGAQGVHWDTTRLDGLQRSMLATLRAPDVLASGLGMALGQAAPVSGLRWIWWRAVAGHPAPLPVERDRLHPEY